MAPANVFRVFLLGILRIHDCEVATLEKIDHLSALGAGKIPRFVLANSIARGQLQLEFLVWFIVGKVGDRSRARGKALPNANSRMISELGAHLDISDLKLHLLQFLNRQMAWELA